jgi:predicted secreted hydrolase
MTEKIYKTTQGTAFTRLENVSMATKNWLRITAWATFKEAKEAGERVYWRGADLYINHKVINSPTA